MSEKVVGARLHVAAVEHLRASGGDPGSEEAMLDAYVAVAGSVEFAAVLEEVGGLGDQELVTLELLRARTSELLVEDGYEPLGSAGAPAADVVRAVAARAVAEVGRVGEPRHDHERKAAARRDRLVDEMVTNRVITAGQAAVHARAALSKDATGKLEEAFRSMPPNPDLVAFASRVDDVVDGDSYGTHLAAMSVLAAKGETAETMTEDSYTKALEQVERDRRREQAKGDLAKIVGEVKVGVNGFEVHAKALEVLADKGFGRDGYGARPYMDAVEDARRRIAVTR